MRRRASRWLSTRAGTKEDVFLLEHYFLRSKKNLRDRVGLCCRWGSRGLW